MRREPCAWGYNWATLSLGDINTHTRTWSSRLAVGLKAHNLALFKKKKKKKNLLQNPKK
jgi:hypothetical protein